MCGSCQKVQRASGVHHGKEINGNRKCADWQRCRANSHTSTCLHATSTEQQPIEVAAASRSDWAHKRKPNTVKVTHSKGVQS